jgi:hypothetical protein
MDEDGLKLKYFVLKPGGDDIYAMASRAAMTTYAQVIEHANLKMANDLRDWANREFRKRAGKLR